jgi:hypothetical protein
MIASTLNLGELEFRLVGEPHLAIDPTRERLGFRSVGRSGEFTGCGVYAVAVNGDCVYIGSFKNGFDKRWLYRSTQELYHFKAPVIEEALRAGAMVGVYALGEDEAKRSLGLENCDWVNCRSLEDRLIQLLRPKWNSIGKGRIDSLHK